MPYVETKGVETYYERHGDGPAIVFIHGAGWDHRSWAPQVDAFRDDYEVVTYDVPGHGKSGTTDRPLESRGEGADHLAGLVDALDLTRPAVIGCSMGGRIAYTYAEKYPDSIRALVTLEAPVNRGSMPLHLRAIQKATITTARLLGPNRAYDLQRRLASLLGHSDDYGDVSVPGLGMTKREYVDDAVSRLDVDELLKQVDAEPYDATLAEITVPTLVVTGEEPVERFAESAEILVEEIPDTRRQTIPNAGHGANMSNPTAFNETVREFLEEVFDESELTATS